MSDRMNGHGTGTTGALGRLSRRKGGGIVSVVGPDGSGKTTLIDALVEGVLGGKEIMRIRTVGTLPRRTAPGIAVTEPHGKPAYSVPLSIAKTAYIYADYVLGWMLRIRPFARKGGWVVIERGWWDIAVDPRRYRMRLPARLLWALGRTLPSPDLLLVLEAPPEVIYARKTELTIAELKRQGQVWRAELPARQRRVYLDASKPAGEVLRLAGEELSGRPQSSKGTSSFGHADLPSSAHPRWNVPRGPRSVALNGLRVYHPVTLRGFAGWRLGRIFASLGGLRLLPEGRKLPVTVIDSLRDHTPAGGSVAVASTNHPGRHVALILAPDGKSVAIAKIAEDDAGRDAITREGQLLSELGPRLSSPLSAPQILARHSGILVLEAVAWQPRLRSWRLPVAVATGLGRFFAAKEEEGGHRSGLSHGDFAPWNLMRTPEEWVLIDWEEASPDGLAFYDVFHFLVQAHALLDRPSQRVLLDGLVGKGWIGEVIRAYAREAGIPAVEARRYFEPYLTKSRGSLDPSTWDGRVGLAARDALARELAG